VLSTGDLVASGNSDALWAKFDEITGEMRKTIPYYAAFGNHDEGGVGFADRALRPKNSGKENYYSFDEGKLHFICLDTEHSLKPGSGQYTWLANDLKAARAKGSFVVPFSHIPLFSIGGHGSSEELQQDLLPLYKKYGVKLSFYGHDHLYYRTFREGATWVVTGGGGAPLYPMDTRKALPKDHGAVTYHFCICDVYSDKIKTTVYTPDMKKIDEFEVKIGK
jgi:acid phosphatase type 7